MVAEAALLTPLGWVASPLIKKLFDKAHDYLGTGINKRRKILEATVLPRLSLVIEKAEKSPNKKKLVDWLKRLKGAYYEAEDAIDLLEYEQLKQEVKDHRITLKQKAKNEKGTPISLPLKFVRRPIKIASDKLKSGLSVFSPQKIMLKHCIDNLIKIAEEAKDFLDLLGGPEKVNGSDADRETSSNSTVMVFGRQIDKEKIVSLLTLKPSNSEPGPSTRLTFPIIAITGRSGVGKTALAQYVYKHMDGQEHFDLLVWVHAPRKFKATEVIKNMIEIVNAKERARNDNSFTSLEALSTQIRDMLVSKKLLLLLDDFWSDTEDFVQQWQNFIGCLSSCLPGSRILLTSQSKTAAQPAGLASVTEVETYILEDIDEGQFLDLFMHHAWPSNSNFPKEEFEKIVGSGLREKLDLMHWEEVAKKDWFGDNMKARIWSYQQLPLDLQRCFALCGLLPKGCALPGPYLIELWMAEGFIRPTDKQERLEDIGENYLHELVSRFFIEGEKEKYFQLHDLLHDLAERVQGDDFIRIDSNNSKEVPSHISNMLSRSENICQIRHIYLPSRMINDLKEKLCLMKNICTFFVEPDDGYVPKKVLQEILKNFKKLRVLYLPTNVNDMPDSIGNLKHIRYLYIWGNGPNKNLPDSICKLYHLETLFMGDCESLPKDFSELISLRHFHTVAQTRSHISHIGRLTSLQGLDQFIVRKKRGNELHQLENLNQLRGNMFITGLENVTSTVDALKANMQNKKHLKELKFEWNSDEINTDNVASLCAQHVQLLDELLPHPNTSALTLKGFGGDRFPNWLLSQNSLMHLQSLKLMNCDKVEEISSIGESLPNCKSLMLSGLKNLKKMPTLPPNLIVFAIHHCSQLSYFSEDDLLMKEERKQSKLEIGKQIAEYLKLEYVPVHDDVGLIVVNLMESLSDRLGDTSEICCPPLDDELVEILPFDQWNSDYIRDHISDIWVLFMHWNMETMFHINEESKLVLPSSLKYLELSSCTITDDALSNCIQCLVSLCELNLSNIQTITCLPPKEDLYALKNFKSLTITGCLLLSSLGGFGDLPSLIELKLYLCLNLNITNECLPPSLERLRLFYCSIVDVICPFDDTIPTLDVGYLSCLKELFLIGWDGQLEGLNSLTALYHLWVSSCPKICLEINVLSASALSRIAVDNLSLLKVILCNETISSVET
ncbi:putative disease resistance protein RGA1 [Carex rostrata]